MDENMLAEGDGMSTANVGAWVKVCGLSKGDWWPSR